MDSGLEVRTKQVGATSRHVSQPEQVGIRSWSCRWRSILNPRSGRTPEGGNGGTYLMLANILISPEDADLLSQKWRVNHRGYVVRSVTTTLKQQIHRVVLSRMVGRILVPSEICDHANGNKLDNRRENLRLTDATGNAQNRTVSWSNSGYRGVSWHKQLGKWQAQVRHKDKMHYCGLWDTREGAAAAAACKRAELGFLGATP